MLGRRSRLIRGLLLVALAGGAVACRSQFSADGGDGTDPTETDGDVYQVCRACQAGDCADHLAACEGDTTCASCFDRPYAFECVSNELFQNLAGCSCFACAPECDYLCPAGQGACQSCGLSACPDESIACSGAEACQPCISDPAAPGCDEDPTFQDFLSCACASCGQECVWSCPEAVSDCSTCAIGSCSGPYGDCLQDEVCSVCAENPAPPECLESELSQALQECICSSCEADCGILFRCEG